jgi:hypothetical protein
MNPVPQSDILDDLIRCCSAEQTEAVWLECFELLRRSLSESLKTEVQIGCYWIDESDGNSGAGGTARIRGRAPLEGIESDSWEGILSWSGYRERKTRAVASIFPFLKGSVVQQRGRLADLGPDAETEELLDYPFENGRFVRPRWLYGDGPGEWAGVVAPGNVYWQNLTLVDGPQVFQAGEPITIRLRLSKHEVFCRERARVSLVHVNRGREHTNLVPWTAQPPKTNSQHVQSIAYADMSGSDTVVIHLNRFAIRGGWIPGRYHLTVRIQNLRDPKGWTYTADISHPIQITVVG